MIHKRSFVDEGAYEVAHKQPRNCEKSNHFAPVANDGAHQKYCASGDDTIGKSQVGGRFVDDPVTKVSNGTDKEFETGSSSCISNFWWVDGNVIEADSDPDAAVHLSFFPEYFAPADQLRALLQPNEIYSSLFDCPSPKLVSVGPEHQADIPEWVPQGLNSSADHLGRSDPHLAQSMDSGIMVEDGNEERLMGTCVIPMPGFEESAIYGFESWGSRTDCKCLDNGSVRCVRQHAMEARESLRKNLGQEVFEELGFSDMGEDVAKKWTEEEEQAFHSVVHSNPATLGKNFWYHLSEVFPTRTKKNLVSYYFNVFMLQKRAEQNRFDPLNIDSDNDEWQRTEDGMAEEDEDSVVESLNSQGASACYQEDQTEDFPEDIEDEVEVDAHEDVADAVVHGVATDEEDEGDVDDMLGGVHVENFIGACGGDRDYYQLLGKIQSNTSDNYDIQDDSCTSYEYQRDNVDCCSPPYMVTDTRQSSEE